jgi:hypothetical protein
MSACCKAGGVRKTRALAPRIRAVFAWALPSAILALTPKCPACLAAYLLLWTGVGLSLAAATYLRWALLLLGVAALLFLIRKRLDRVGTIFRYFKKENEPCHTKS